MLSGLDTSRGNMMTHYRAVLISTVTSNEMCLKCERDKTHVYILGREVVYKSPLQSLQGVVLKTSSAACFVTIA